MNQVVFLVPIKEWGDIRAKSGTKANHRARVQNEVEGRQGQSHEDITSTLGKQFSSRSKLNFNARREAEGRKRLMGSHRPSKKAPLGSVHGERSERRKWTEFPGACLRKSTLSEGLLTR